MENNQNNSRRQFIESSVALGALGAFGVSQFLSSCSSGNYPKIDPIISLDEAPEGEPIKCGVVGCGGRGTGAAFNFLNAGEGLSIVACADVFQDKVDRFRTRLKEERGVEIDDANCFTGFDGYKRLLETDVNYVILATPPYFRPEQFQAAVDARKHVFMEKPVAVDPVGARSVMSASRQAEAAGLSVVTGTQRRHSRDYLEIWRQVQMGQIGLPVAANVYWNQSKLWHRQQLPGWTEMEFMIRDWVNWTWLSGDHIVEQHIHQLDVLHWFMGKVPESAVGMGSRQRRLTGDCYDNFSVDYVFEDDVHMHSMCRQINDCANFVGQFLRGTEGYTNCSDEIWSHQGESKYKYAYPLNDEGEPDEKLMKRGMDQEHIDLIAAIRSGEQVVTAEDTAKSTLIAIMGRESAYTGMEKTWEEMMSSDMQLGPDQIELGPVDLEVVIPKPGSAARMEDSR